MEYYVAKTRNDKSKYLSLIIFFKGSKETRKNQQKEAFVYTLLKNKRILTSLSGCFSMVFSQKRQVQGDSNKVFNLCKS